MLQENDLSAPFAYPLDLLQSPYRVRYGAEDEGGDNRIEGLIVVLEILNVHVNQIHRNPFAIRLPPGPAQHPRTEVDGRNRLANGVEVQVFPRPHSHLQNGISIQRTENLSPPPGKNEFLQEQFHEVIIGGNTVVSGPYLLCTIFDHFVKSPNQTAKKKDPDARRANPEE